jgi:hypothetical protein
VDPSRTDDVPFWTAHHLPEGPAPGPAGPVVTDRDRAIARALLAGAALGMAWLVLRVPAVRRVAWRGARSLLISGLPALLAREVRQAWRASAAPSTSGGERDPVPPPGPPSGA